jgi:hypothetical protein
MIQTRCKCQLDCCADWVVLSTRSRNNATQGYIQQHSSKRHKIAAIGGGIGGVVLLFLLILMVFLFRRRRPQKQSLYGRFSVRPPRTPKLPMQPPPVWKISSPFCASDSCDIESIIAPYTIPLGPNESESPCMDDAHVKLRLPETCVTRDAYDGRSGEFQIQSKAVRWLLSDYIRAKDLTTDDCC